MSIEEKLDQSTENTSKKHLGRLAYSSIYAIATFAVATPLMTGLVYLVNKSLVQNQKVTTSDNITFGIGLGVAIGMCGLAYGADRWDEKYPYD